MLSSWPLSILLLLLTPLCEHCLDHASVIHGQGEHIYHGTEANHIYHDDKGQKNCENGLGADQLPNGLLLAHHRLHDNDRQHGDALDGGCLRLGCEAARLEGCGGHAVNQFLMAAALPPLLT